MALCKELGKIQSISMGMGGYQDAMFGVSITLGGKGWGVGDFKGTWANRTEGCEWTVADQRKIFAETMEWLRDLMAKAEVSKLSDLKGVPVEVTFDVNTLHSWRVLEEVV